MRFHLPIITNDKVSMIVTGKEYRMLPGHIYAFDVLQMHSAKNGGIEDRIHLVFDFALNDSFLRKIFQVSFFVTLWEYL
jgi:aspartyl/asparaginyl beta-hydroxylase (cupin superfamily)